MPMFVRFQGLDKPGSFLRFLSVPTPDQTGSLEYSIRGTGADCNQVLIQHHISQSPVTFAWVLTVKFHNNRFLPSLQPEVTWDQAIMLIHLAITISPLIKFAASDTDPADKPVIWNKSQLAVITNKVNHFVPKVRNNPSVF